MESIVKMINLINYAPLTPLKIFGNKQFHLYCTFHDLLKIFVTYSIYLEKMKCKIDICLQTLFNNNLCTHCLIEKTSIFIIYDNKEKKIHQITKTRNKTMFIINLVYLL